MRRDGCYNAIDDQAERELEEERKRYEAVVACQPPNSDTLRRESQKHFARLTEIFRDSIRRRVRKAG